MYAEDSFPTFDLDLDCEFESSDQKFTFGKKSEHQAQTYTIESGNISAFTTIGKRNSNLDTFSFLEKQHFTLIGIFDGHGDDHVAKFLEKELLYRLSRHPLIETNPENALKETLSKIEEEVIEFFDKGSTVLVLLVKEGIAIVANIGDCKLFGLEKETGKLTALTVEHNLENQCELSDIMQKGGLIFKRGNEYRINGELNISRSIGDRKHKHYMSSEPDIYSVPTALYKKFILATDGFYKHELFEKELCRRNLKEIEKKVRKGSTGYGFDDNATAICFKNRRKSSIRSVGTEKGSAKSFFECADSQCSGLGFEESEKK